MRKIIVLFLVIFIIPSLVEGQNLSNDSLISVVKNSGNDSLSLINTIKIASHFENKNPDSAIYYYKIGLKVTSFLAQNNNYMSFALSKKADILRWVGLVFYFQGKYDSALFYYNKSIVQNQEIGNLAGMAKVQNNIGVIYSDLGDYPQALDFHTKSLQLKKEINDSLGVAASLNNIGYIHFWQGNFDKALELNLNSLKLYEVLNNKKGIANIYNDIGNIYEKQKNYETALDYNLKAKEIKEIIGDKRGLAKSYNDIGNILAAEKKYQEAKEYYNKSLQIREELNDILGMAHSYGNLAIVNERQGFLDKALYNSKKSLSNYNKVGDKRGIAESYMDMGNIYLKQSSYNRALQFFKKSYNLALEIGTLPQQKNAAEAIKKTYWFLGNYKESVRFADIFIALNDSIFSLEKTKVINDIGTRYEIEKRELQIENLNKEKELQNEIIARKNAESKKQRIIIFSFLTGFILILAFSFFLYRLVLAKAKINKKLEAQKQQIEMQNSFLQQANEEISSQRDLATKQHEILEQTHSHITNSLRYAQSIQAAILPSENMLKQISPECFVLMKPCELVSGDFFWATTFENFRIFCVADCTGHGVPGAFMSILGITALNEIVSNHRVTKPSEILGYLRASVIESLSQNDPQHLHKDGMDIGICVYNTESMQLQFAGARIPLWLVADNNSEISWAETIPSNFVTENNVTLYEVKGDIMPVGTSPKMEPFSNHSIYLNKPVSLYLATDGFADQFGYIKGKKFGNNRLKNQLLYIEKLSAEEKKQHLEKTFNEWKGSVSQIDDMLILCISIGL